MSVFCRFCYAMKLPFSEQATKDEQKTGQESAGWYVSMIDMVKLIYEEQSPTSSLHDVCSSLVVH